MMLGSHFITSSHSPNVLTCVNRRLSVRDYTIRFLLTNKMYTHDKWVNPKQYGFNMAG